jgi:hypothetical protein
MVENNDESKSLESLCEDFEPFMEGPSVFPSPIEFQEIMRTVETKWIVEIQEGDDNSRSSNTPAIEPIQTSTSCSQVCSNAGLNPDVMTQDSHKERQGQDYHLHFDPTATIPSCQYSSPNFTGNSSSNPSLNTPNLITASDSLQFQDLLSSIFEEELSKNNTTVNEGHGIDSSIQQTTSINTDRDQHFITTISSHAENNHSNTMPSSVHNSIDEKYVALLARLKTGNHETRPCEKLQIIYKTTRLEENGPEVECMVYKI